MGKILALDVGRIRIGIAASDLLKIIANPIQTYKTRGRDEDTDYIAQLCKTMDVETVVVGLPLNLDGTESRQTQLTKIFAQLLQTKLKIPVVFQDERLTSVTAEQVLIEANMRRENRKDVIDQVAATIILQDYLNHIKKEI